MNSSRPRWGNHFRFGLLVLLPLVSFVFCSQAEIPAPEKLLPDDTLIMVTAPNFTKIREIYRSAPQSQLWNDPAMKPFKDKFLAKLEESITDPLERDLGVRLSEYADLPQGQVTFAVTQNGWPATPDTFPGVLLLLDSKGKSSQLKTNLAALRRKWVNSGKPIKTDRIRDVEFSIYQVSSADLPKALRNAFVPHYAGEDTPAETETNGTPKHELVVGQYESLLILGNSTRAVEKIAVHLTGGAMPSLSDLAAYQANHLSMFRESPFYGWLNVKAIVDAMNRKPSSADPDAEDSFPMFSPAKILAAIGLNGLKTLAFNVQYSNEGSSFQLFVGAPESTRAGLFKIFQGEARESGPPPFVPATAVKFQRYRIDGQKAWKELQKVMNDISPELLSRLNLVFDTADTAAKEKDPNFDNTRNLFGNLGDDIISYEKAPTGNTLAELNSPPSLFLIGSPNPEQFQAALKNVLMVTLGQSTEREFLGRKIYSVQLPSVTVPSGGPLRAVRRSLSYAATSGYVALTTDTSMLEEYLRSSDSQQKTLRETPGLMAAAAKVGGFSTGLFGYENQAETSRAFFEALRKSASAPAGGGTTDFLRGAMGIPDVGGWVKDWFDFSLLPPFEKIEKYFSFTVYSGGANAEGLTLKMFSPVPPQLKK